MQNKTETINSIRRFNRFYTVLLGFLNQNYLGTGFSVTETRILFEVKLNNDISAKELCELLKLDKSYMSRMIRSFEKNGIVFRKVCESDKRANQISLTEKGKDIVAELISATNKEIALLIDGLSAEDCDEVSCAMDTIIKHLDINNYRRKSK